MISINLLDHQRDHANRLLSVLKRSKVAIDLSPTGTGKTYVGTWIAQKKKLPIVVICPKNVQNVWNSLAKEHNMRITTLTYDRIKIPKYGWVGINPDRTFYCTSSARRAIKSGFLLIVDEAHKLKNRRSQQSQAMMALQREIILGRENPTKILWLSATLMDNKKQIPNYMDLLGYDKQPNVTGYLRDIFRNDPYRIPRKTEEKYDLLFSYFMEEIIKYYSSSMKQSVVFPHEVRNMSRPFSTKYLEEDYVKVLKSISAVEGIGSFTLWLRHLQNAKSVSVIISAKEVLEKKPNAKVVLFSDYHQTQKQYMDNLSEYSPMLINGHTKDEDRLSYISKFQEDNNDRRLIIMSTTIGNVGISLHDIYGGRPRHMFLMPGYRTIEIQQCIGRIYRTGTKSPCYTRIVYGPYNGGFANAEKKMMEKIWDKTNVIKTVQSSAGSDMLFTCDFEWDIVDVNGNSVKEDEIADEANTERLMEYFNRCDFLASNKKQE